MLNKTMFFTNYFKTTFWSKRGTLFARDTSNMYNFYPKKKCQCILKTYGSSSDHGNYEKFDSYCQIYLTVHVHVSLLM